MRPEQPHTRPARSVADKAPATLTKTDPYASKTHRRIDVILLVITILILFFVLRASAHGQTVTTGSGEPREGSGQIVSASNSSTRGVGGVSVRHSHRKPTVGGDPAYTGPGGTTTAPVTGNWNTSTNWSPNGVPGGGAALSFGGSGSSSYTSTNDLTNYTLGAVSLTSTSTATDFIAGNTVLIGNATSISQDNSGAFTISIGFSTQNGTSQTLTLTGNGTGLATLSGVISDSNKSNAVTKTGSSTFALSGSNNYSGGTSVTGGTLLVNNTSGSGTGSGNVTVNGSGTTLGGTGTISGSVSVSNTSGGAIINPGPKGTNATAGSVGTLTIGGAVTLGSSGNSSTLHIDASGTLTSNWDQLVANGVTLNATTKPTLDVTIASGLTFTSGTVYELINNTSASAISGTFNGIAQGSTVTFDGYSFFASYTGGTGNDFTLTVVPEPSTWIAAALTFFALAFTQRRRLARLLVHA